MMTQLTDAYICIHLVKHQWIGKTSWIYSNTVPVQLYINIYPQGHDGCSKYVAVMRLFESCNHGVWACEFQKAVSGQQRANLNLYNTTRHAAKQSCE